MPFATNERINNKYVRKSNKSGFDVTLSQFNYILLLFFLLYFVQFSSLQKSIQQKQNKNSELFYISINQIEQCGKKWFLISNCSITGS